MVLLAASAFTYPCLLPARRSSAAPSLLRGSAVHGLTSTMGRSDSRSALPHFTVFPLIRLGAPVHPWGGAPGLASSADSGRRRVSPVPTMALPPFHVLYAVGF